MTGFTVGQAVHDAWWPWRQGCIERVGVATVRVRWVDGEAWTYDQDHLPFLRREGR